MSPFQGEGRRFESGPPLSMNSRDKKIISDFLQSQKLMSIATYNKHPWIASVYYVTNDDLCLYFISPPNADHSVHIKSNNHVACCIADSSQKAGSKKIGMQIYGTAKQEQGLETIKWMLRMYNKLHPSTKDKLNFTPHS